jgi:hypothetical protein
MVIGRFRATLVAIALALATAACSTSSGGTVAADAGADAADSGADGGAVSDDAGGFDASANCGSPGLPCCARACSVGCCDGPTQLCAVTCGVGGGGEDD